jgi:hypothetical protein
MAQLMLVLLSFLFTFVAPTKKQNGAKPFPSHTPAEQPVGLQLSDLVDQTYKVLLH